MKRLITLSTTIAVTATFVGPALADPSAPGTTFPEQPRSNPETACVALLSNPGAQSAPRSATAYTITNPLFGDACFGG